jgi:protein-disulfide isomerase-like protein with CxxC motif
VFINVDESPDLTEEWNVSGVPVTMVIQKDGTVSGNVVGNKDYFVRKLLWAQNHQKLNQHQRKKKQQ